MNRVFVKSLPVVSVTPEAAEALRGLASATTLPATDRVALADLGLVDDDGQLSSAGRRLRDDLRSAALLLLFAARPDGTTRRARLYVGTRHLMYLGVHPAEEARQTSELLVFPADAVPIVLAGWGRLQPMAQAPAGSHGPIDRDAFRRRCATPAEPVPAGADAPLAALWRAPWRLWGAQCDAHEISLAYLDVEGFGTYVVRHAAEDALQLAPRPSSLLWGDLQGVLEPLRPYAVDW